MTLTHLEHVTILGVATSFEKYFLRNYEVLKCFSHFPKKKIKNQCAEVSLHLYGWAGFLYLIEKCYGRQTRNCFCNRPKELTHAKKLGLSRWSCLLFLGRHLSSETISRCWVLALFPRCSLLSLLYLLLYVGGRSVGNLIVFFKLLGLFCSFLSIEPLLLADTLFSSLM